MRRRRSVQSPDPEADVEYYQGEYGEREHQADQFLFKVSAWAPKWPKQEKVTRLTKKKATQLTKLHISVGIGITLVYQVMASNPLVILCFSQRSESSPKKVGRSKEKKLGCR